MSAIDDKTIKPSDVIDNKIDDKPIDKDDDLCQICFDETLTNNSFKHACGNSLCLKCSDINIVCPFCRNTLKIYKQIYTIVGTNFTQTYRVNEYTMCNFAYNIITDLLRKNKLPNSYEILFDISLDKNAYKYVNNEFECHINVLCDPKPNNVNPKNILNDPNFDISEEDE